MSVVCGEDANGEEHKNQRGLLASVMESRLSPPRALNRIQCSRHCKEFFTVSERCGKDQNTMEKVALEKAKTETESTVSENATTEARKTGVSGGTSASDAARADRGKATGSSEDDHRQRSCVERSERVLVDEAIADSSTAETKVRQQVEQRLKERKQPKVQNWRGRLMRWRHVSDDDPQRQAVKSNDFLSLGQLRLAVTVCPRCKAVYMSGGVECHDTINILDMEWSMRLIPTNKVSTDDAETMPAMVRFWDSVREGTVKQRNAKAWKATHFRSETESQEVDNKNRSRCGHMRTVTGKGFLADPVSGEDSLRVEQLDYFEKVLENSMATSEERLEQLRRVESNATNVNSGRIHSSSSERPRQQHSDHLSEAPRMLGAQQASYRGLRRTQRSRET